MVNFYFSYGSGILRRCSGLPDSNFLHGSVPKRSNGADCKSAGFRLRGFESLPAHHSIRRLNKIAMKKYYIYLARCSDDTIYTGYTVNLKEREIKHNAGEGAKYTKARCPVQIVYSENFKTKSAAMKREAEIKSFTRLEKEKLIKSAKGGVNK